MVNDLELSPTELEKDDNDNDNGVQIILMEYLNEHELEKYLEETLEKLAIAQAEQEKMEIKHYETAEELVAEERAKHITPEIQEAIDLADEAENLARQKVDLALAGGLFIIGNKVEKLTDEVKDIGLLRGTSYKGENLHMVYRKGSVTWSKEGLLGYAVSHPQILGFQKVGKPSISIRVSKKTE